MAFYTVTVVLLASYSIEANTKEEAERLVQNELPSNIGSVNIISTELET